MTRVPPPDPFRGNFKPLDPAEVLSYAIEACGSRTALAHRLEISTSTLDKIRGLDFVPAKHCCKLAWITGINPALMNDEVFDQDLFVSGSELRLLQKIRKLRGERGRELLRDIETMLDLEPEP